MIVGIHFRVPTGISREDFVHEWSAQTLQRSQERGFDIEVDNYYLLTIRLPCGELVAYGAEDDIPLVDVPCTCGDAAHWFIKYEEVE